MSQSKTSVKNHEESSDVSFVKRWSRLKQETRQDIDNETVEKKSAAAGIPDDERRPASETLTDKDMPDIDSLTSSSDFTDFLSPGVSEELRKLALRKLFRSEVFNIRDGLDEYDDDFTQFEALGDVVTSDMKHQLELEAQRKVEQMQELDKPLSDAATPELEHIDDLVDENRKAGHQQDISQPPLDESKTQAAEDALAKNTVAYSFTTDASVSLESGVNHEQKPDRSDDDSGTGDEQAKKKVNTS